MSDSNARMRDSYIGQDDRKGTTMNSLPAGTSANLFLPQPSIELGYGLLLTSMETYKLSFEMKTALRDAKTSAGKTETFPRPADGNVGLAAWFFKQEYPTLTLRNYEYTDEETGDLRWSFAVISCDILVGQSIEHILMQYNYELPLPEYSVLDDINNFRRKFSIADEIGWKHWL